MPLRQLACVQRTISALGSVVERLCCGRAAGKTGHDTPSIDQARLLRRLLGISRLQEALLQPASIEQKLQQIAETATELLDLDDCRIWTVGQADACMNGCHHAAASAPEEACPRRDRCLHLAAESGDASLELRPLRRLPIGDSPLGRVISGELRRFLIQATTATADEQDQAWARGLGFDAVAGYRLANHHGTALGLLAAFAKRPLSAIDDVLLANVAAIATQAVLDAQVQERLREQTALATMANRAKSEFLANMSHEIRTPMTAVLGFTDLLLSTTPSPDQQHEFLLAIQRNGRALLDVLNGLLELSKIEAGKLNVERTACSVEEVIDGLVAAVAPRVRQKALKLEIEYAERVPGRIHSAPKRLQQILLKLVGNAIKFTERGRIRVTIRLVADAEGRQQLQFAVSDTGIGIASDKLGQLFQPFVQLDGSATRRYGGVGLGLVTARRLAHSLGGDIAVQSELGSGSTFTLSIDPGPLGDQPQVASQCRTAIAAAEPSAAADETPFEGKVLLVEDATDLRQLLGCLVRHWGPVVDLAENGREGCRRAEQSLAEGAPYDLILMDMQMPEMDGYEATRWLRAQGWRGPIVALTAHAMPGDREHCLTAGCDDYCAKPVERDQLHQLLRRHLHQSPPAGASAAAVAEDDALNVGKASLVAAHLVTQLRDTVCADFAAQTDKMRTALLARDLDSVARLARKMQSSASMFGFARIAAKAGTVYENTGDHLRLEQLQASITALTELCSSAAGMSALADPWGSPPSAAASRSGCDECAVGADGGQAY